MSSSDVDMLRLEAPVTRLQITNGTEPTSPAIELRQPASWVRTLVQQHQQARQDIQQLYELCGGQIDQSDRRIREIERAYDTLYRGTLYVYEQAQAQEVASQ
jgi:hypothetical protein